MLCSCVASMPAAATKTTGGVRAFMEVMSPNDPKRDSEIKKREYAMAGIPEYWLIDPTGQSVAVFVLDDTANRYSVHGVYQSGQLAASMNLSPFVIDVRALFAQDL